MTMQQIACVVDGQGFELPAADVATIMEATAPGAVPALTCSDDCAFEYDVNCLDWTEEERAARDIKPF